MMFICLRHDGKIKIEQRSAISYLKVKGKYTCMLALKQLILEFNASKAAHFANRNLFIFITL